MDTNDHLTQMTYLKQNGCEIKLIQKYKTELNILKIDLAEFLQLQLDKIPSVVIELKYQFKYCCWCGHVSIMILTSDLKSRTLVKARLFISRRLRTD